MERYDEAPDPIPQEALYTPVLFAKLLSYRKAGQIRDYEMDEAMTMHIDKCIHAAVEMGLLSVREVYGTEERHGI